VNGISRTTKGLALAASLSFALALVVGACASGQAPPAPGPIEGLVVSVETSGSNEVGVTIRLADGSTMRFAVGALVYPLPPGHLAAHQVENAPVRVSYVVENGQRVAYEIVDAPTK
jgi:hypothetical protein